MTSVRLSTTILLVLAGGCAKPPAPIAPAVDLTPPPVSSDSAAAEPVIVGVATARAPAGIVIDGDLREWGALPAPPPSLPRPESNDEPDDPSDAKTKPPNPADASSRLVFALTGDAALIAAELGEQARDGIWVGIGTRVPDLPLLGEYFGREGFVVLNCERKITLTDMQGAPEGAEQGYSFEARLPEEQTACKALEARRAEVKAEHEKRFARLFKIDREGVRGVAEGGALVAIEGARSAWRPGPRGATVEVSLPLSAMPRAGEAPLQRLRLVARAAPTTPVLTLGQWVWVDLPEAVSFEPYAALRAHALARALEVGEFNYPGTTSYKQPWGMSYQPGAALRIEIMDAPSCDAVTPGEEPLYEKLARLGDVEVGRVAAPEGSLCSRSSMPWVAVFVKGKLAGMIKLKGDPRGAVERSGELHVLAYNRDYYAVPAIWSGVAISPTGAHRDLVVEPVAGVKETKAVSYWSDVSAVAGKDLDGFGWRGTKGGRGVEATWRWDAVRKRYVGEQRSLPAPKKAKKGER